MTLEQDLENLKKKLTGDKKKDIKTLFSSLEEYNDRPYLSALLSEIIHLMKNTLSSADKKTIQALKAYSQKVMYSQYDHILMEIKRQVDHQEYQHAIEYTNLLEKELNEQILIAKREHEGKDQDLSFRFYFSPMEYDLSDTYFPGNCCLLPIDPVSLYVLRGQSYFFLGEDEKAVDTIRYAFRFNPVSVDICFLLADIEKQRMNSLSYLTYIDRAKDYLYKESDYLRYLRYLSDYYRSFENDEKTAKAIDTLLKKGKNYKGITVLSPSKWNSQHKKILDNLSKKKIDIYISDNVIKTAKTAYQKCLKDKDTEGINYYKSLLVPFIDKSDLPTIK